MSANAIYRAVDQMIPPQKQIASKCYGLLSNVAINLNKIAVPTIALLALSSFTGAEAGPLEYSACVLACNFFCTPAAFPGCITACLPILFLPTP